jgi:UDP-N-acetylglucosamine 2-epimerase (non-hydrolysing)
VSERPLSGTMKLAFVVGTRPNFMKAAPVLAELRRRQALGKAPGVEAIVVHTGQHYDSAMSDVFFRDLELPPPDEYLGVGSGPHGRQTAKVMAAFEEVCERRRPDAVVVPGDVNSTMACALVAAKMGIPVAHLEAGLRSFDRTMPEEVNRVVTDQVSDLLLTTCEDANANLRREGLGGRTIRLVGNPMIDSLVAGLRRLGAERTPLASRASGGGTPCVLVTLHRPGNVDEVESIAPIVEGLERVARRAVVLFPVHPRTADKLHGIGERIPSEDNFKGGSLAAGLYLLPPLPYPEFIGVMRSSTLVLTDSGGVQEETTFLGVPCATLRPNTERPVTVTIGTNELVGRNPDAIERAANVAITGRWKRGSIPALWDGKASERIVDALLEPAWRRSPDYVAI